MIATAASRVLRAAAAPPLARAAAAHFSSSAAASSSAPAPAAPAKAKAARAPSSLKEGSVMKGLAVLKDQADPVALKDEEYPAWLWTILDKEPKSSAPEGEFDFLAERKRLRKQNRTNIKATNYLKTT